MAITQKIFIGISSNFLHSIRTSICIRKCNKKFFCIFGAIFWKKAWAIVQGIFQKLADFFKMAITQKIFIGISSNFLYSIRTSICIRKCNKNFLHFWSHFLEKSMGYSTGNFSNIGRFFKMAITQKILAGISSNFLHSISTSICIRKCNKIFFAFSEPFFGKKHGL